jgi:hypothetical protein
MTWLVVVIATPFALVALALGLSALRKWLAGKMR